MFESLKRNLEARGFRVSTFATAADAVSYLATAIQGTTVGFGGSVTLREMGLYPALSRRNRVSWHWEPTEGKTGAELLSEASRAEIYLSSVNAIAETGEIVNIDGTGNRVASIFYGHKTVYLVVGRNKVAPTAEEAVRRARNVAAPRNAQRLNRQTPCVASGGDRCYDCRSPERICRGLQVLWEAPGGAAYEVVLVDEDLGY